jgi:hypothetical protein
MNMTVAKLTKLNACPEGIQYFKDHKFKTVEQAITEILKTDHRHKRHWSNWLISRSLSKMDRKRYAIYAAEQVIGIFEKKYPKDKRPRKAIQAAKRYLKNPSKEYKEKYKAASWSAVGAAVNAAAWSTVRAAAWSTAYVGISASCTADYAAKAAAPDHNKMFEKIIKYGLKLLKGV